MRWNLLTSLLRGRSRSARRQSPCSPFRSRPCLEHLEDRVVPTVTAAFNGVTGTLTVAESAGPDNYAISSFAGFVVITDTPPPSIVLIPPTFFVPASSVKTINITDSGTGVTADLTGLALTSFTSLKTLTVNDTGASFDTIKMATGAIPMTTSVSPGPYPNSTFILTGSGTNGTVSIAASPRFMSVDSATITGAPLFEHQEFLATVTNLTVDSDQFAGGRTDNIGVSPLAGVGTGVNRLVEGGINGDPFYALDFQNPTTSLTVAYPITGSVSNTLNFNGLAPTGQPTNVLLDIGAGAGTVNASGFNISSNLTVQGEGGLTAMVTNDGLPLLTVTGGPSGNTLTVHDIGTNVLTVTGGAGADTILVYNIGATIINVSGGTAGTDSITIHNVGFNAMTITTGTGTTTTTLNSFGGNSLFVNSTAGGTNALTMANVGLGALTLLGDGSDTAHITSSGFGSFFDSGFTLI
jgi:hypothetical protein